MPATNSVIEIQGTEASKLKLPVHSPDHLLRQKRIDFFKLCNLKKTFPNLHVAFLFEKSHSNTMII